MERISEAYKDEPTASQKNAVFDAMLDYFEGEMPAGFEHGGADREFASGDGDYGLADEYSIRIQTPDGIPGGAYFFSFAKSQPSVVNALASAGYSEEDVEERSFSRAYEGDGYIELYLSVPRALEGGSFSASSPSELAKVLEREFGVPHLGDGFRGWVFPDGTPVSVPEEGNHKSLARWIADHVDYGGMRIPSTKGDGSPFVEDEIGGIRVNLDGEDYVRLNEKEPTREQYDALRGVFGLGRGISIHFPYGNAGEGHSTAVEADPSKGAEYYLRLIRRFYSSREYPRDYESLSKGKLKEAKSLGGGVFATESPYEVKSVLNSAADETKVLYDPKKRLYVYGKANDYIHNGMLEKAWEAGYYPELQRWELPEYEGEDGSEALVYLWFIPGGDDGGRTIGVDDYTEEWAYPNGILCARSHYSDTPLYDQAFELPRVLGKPKSMYVVGDWETMEPKRLDPEEPHSANESYLAEKTRQQLLDKSRNGAAYAPDNRAKGKNRYERRKYSKVAATIKDYNSIDMNAFFKGDYLEFGVPVHGETDDYVVTVTFERILPRLQQEVRSDRNRLSEKAVLRALLGAFNTGDVYVSCTCLHPDTRIKLLDGTNPTVAEMKERFDKGEKLYVYSADGKGDFKPGEVEKVWVAKTARDFVKVTLDDGQEILTTPDHPYMLRNGEYAEAKDLVPGTSLMHVDGVEHKVAKAERVALEDTPVYDIQVKDWHNFALDAGVVVHNCKDFQFAGFNYLAVKQDYNSNPIFGKAMQPPTIRNPKDDKGAACKHILRVLSDVSWMMNVARVIYNYIKVSRELMQRNYAEIIFPKVYGRPYKGVVQMSLMDKDDMWGDALLQSDKRELDAVIAAAKQGRDVRGRFSRGNPYAFRKRDAQAGPTLSKGGTEDADDSGQPSDMHA